ncbi:NAD(P)H-dependent oxidoreductase subunit E, partial [bacterium]|nr:NAD(P)H-dependent oxidoreductase subunit E [bacterium]
MCEQSEQMRKINQIIDRYKKEKGALVPLLQDVMGEYGYLPEKTLKRIAQELDIPLSQAYGLATFYKSFSLTPRGKHLISVCLGTACHVRGAPRIVEKLERDLGIKAGETTKNLKFTLETVNCLGACALGPLIVIDGKYYG